MAPVSRGVSGKVMGRFTEDDVYVGNYRWDEGDGVLTLGPERTQLLWVIDGKLAVDGNSYDRATVIFSEFGETTRLAGPAGARRSCSACRCPSRPGLTWWRDRSRASSSST